MKPQDVHVRVMLLGSCLADLFGMGLSEADVRAVVADALVPEETVEVLALGGGVPDIITTHRESPPAPTLADLPPMSEPELRQLAIRSAAALCASELVTAGKMTPAEFTDLYELWLRTRRLVVSRGRVNR